MGLLGKPDPRPFYGVIADGVHSHPFAVNIAHRVSGCPSAGGTPLPLSLSTAVAHEAEDHRWQAHPAGLVLVTDAIQAMGLAPGRHSLGSMSVDIEGSRAYVEGTRTLAGSIVRMDQCVPALPAPGQWLHPHTPCAPLLTRSPLRQLRQELCAHDGVWGGAGASS